MSHRNLRLVEKEDNSPKQLGILPLAEVPLVSFEKSIEELIDLVPSIEQYSQAALDFYDTYENNEEGLTKDEIAAINLYTQENAFKRENSFYYILNQRLRDPNRKNIQHFMSYLKILYGGLFKLKPFDCSKQRLWRAVQLDQIPQEGTILRWWGFSSCTYDTNVLNDFISDVPVIFNINTFKSVDIRKFSCYPRESEVIVIPPVQFKVTNSTKIKDVIIIELSENYEGNSFKSCYMPWKDNFLKKNDVKMDDFQERNKLQQEKDNLEVEKKKFQKEKDNWEVEKKRIQQENNDVQLQKNKIQQEREYLKAEMTSLNDQQKALKIEIAKLQQEKQSLENEKNKQKLTTNTPINTTPQKVPPISNNVQQITWGKSFRCQGCNREYEWGNWFDKYGFFDGWYFYFFYLKGSKNYDFVRFLSFQ
eukprot:TRINITY_DN2191_c0_g1_i4.p1 TRINITY_DN2191_c0_g1~~TRINITY_DN2191_c0_g1_i4.p1  ORF type:complete len:420 (-),score=137.93 TRINITY_DN2191_c0_g1_i4:318-1577(-)